MKKIVIIKTSEIKLEGVERFVFTHFDNKNILHITSFTMTKDKI